MARAYDGARTPAAAYSGNNRGYIILTRTGNSRRPLIYSSWILVTVVWVIFVIRGVFYATVLPVWEGYDEWSHFAFIQHLHTRGTLPLVDQTRVSREVAESLNLLPLPWSLRELPPHVTHDAYWQLSPQERRRREEAFASLPRQWAWDEVPHAPISYEAKQPPLAFLLSLPVLLLTEDLPLGDRVFWLRYFNIIIASFAVPIGFLTARRVFRDDITALCVIALMSVMPEFFISVGRVSNEAAAVIIYSLLTYIALRIIEEPTRLVWSAWSGFFSDWAY